MNDEQDARPTLIYRLIDPRDGRIRYIGKTVETLNDRLSNHLYTKENNQRGNWIRLVLRDGYKPVIESIEIVPPDEDWKAREIYWIKWHRDNGFDLVNATDGIQFA